MSREYTRLHTHNLNLQSELIFLCLAARPLKSNSIFIFVANCCKEQTTHHAVTIRAIQLYHYYYMYTLVMICYCHLGSAELRQRLYPRKMPTPTVWRSILSRVAFGTDDTLLLETKFHRPLAHSTFL